MTEQNQLNQQSNPDDKLSTGLQVLSFCIPIAGAIIYFNNKGTIRIKQNQLVMQLFGGLELGF